MTNQLLQLTWSNKDLALIPTETGKYGYRWVSPSDPRYCETHTLEITDHVVGSQAPKEDGVTYSERADLTPTDDNLLILGESGDVLEALTRVPELADKYAGQVKCIYIDPPFNTAQTFTNYEDNLQHSVWLTMMRDRLQHMHKLLSDEGSIWVHLDDVENHRMRVLLDEVFGPENFVTTIAWQKKTTRDNRAAFSSSHDYIHVYSKKGESNWKDHRNRLEDTGKFSNPDNDPRGPWRSVPMSAQAGRATQSQFWTVTTPTGVKHQPPRGRAWTYTEPRFKELEKAGMIYWPRNGDGKPRLKKFPETGDGLVPNTWWTADEVGDNDSAKKALLAMFPDIEAFDTPKPERLLERVIHVATNPGDIVLDIFGGSGTTAAVAQKMGRRWVTCELKEDNFTQFTRPRLEKVVYGHDQSGVSHDTRSGRIPANGSDIPEGMTAEEAQKFTSLLNKLIHDDDELKTNEVTQTLKVMAKTMKRPETVNWRGGGGFTVARLSPACFDYDETLGLTLLTDAATGDTLINSAVANLNFYRTPDDPVFHGIRGRMRLVVVEGTLLTSRVDELLAELADGELLTIATTEPDEAIRSHLRQVKRGCRMVHIPDDIFHPTTVAGLLADDTVQEA